MLLLQIEVSNHSLQFQNVTDHTELDVEEEDESNLWQLRKAENFKILIFLIILSAKTFSLQILIIFDEFSVQGEEGKRREKFGRRENGNIDIGLNSREKINTKC